MVEAVGLCKRFGAITAIDNLNFHVETGEIVGLIGANGAGKSTTIHVLLGLISRTSGELRIFGFDPQVERERVYSRLNFTSPYVGLPPRLTVAENLRIYARLYGVAEPAAKVARQMRRLSCEHLRDRPTGRLSSGEMSRVLLCKALLNDPALLFLDEPTANLDPCAADEVKALLRELRARHGTSVLLTSHNLDQVAELCDRIIVIDNGRALAVGTPIEVTRIVLGEHEQFVDLAGVFRAVAGSG